MHANKWFPWRRKPPRLSKMRQLLGDKLTAATMAAPYFME